MASSGPMGCNSSRKRSWSAKSSASLSYRCGLQISTSWESRPCFRAFILEAARPLGVLGPVDFWALARLAAMRSSEVVFNIISNGYGFWVCGFELRAFGMEIVLQLEGRVTRVPICFSAKDRRISAIGSPERVVPTFPERGALLRVNKVDSQSNAAADLYSPSHPPTLTPRVGQPWGEAAFRLRAESP